MAHSRRQREADAREYRDDKIMQLHERVGQIYQKMSEAPLQEMPEIVSENLAAVNLVLYEIKILRLNSG